jgi:CheY-like chemotaxis protein
MLARLVGEEVRLTWEPGAALWAVKMDGSQVDQLVTNLCVNARDAIAEHGVIKIATDNCVWPGGVDSLAGDYVRLIVTDDGGGISPDIVAHIFEPFFTTKEIGKGTGLGLATVHGVVRQNHGFILVESTPGEGTRFAIHLPRHASPVEPPERVIAAARPRVSQTILVVEDEPAILRIAARLLEAQGYRVLQASSARIALDLAERYGADIALLVTDVVMPEMNGPDLAGRLAERFPHLRRLYMSGYTPEVIAPRGVAAEGAHFLQKPFTRNELATKVHEALSSYQRVGDASRKT